MAAQEISNTALIFALLLLTIPLVLSRIFGLKIVKPTLTSVGRMGLQLFLMAIFLRYLFQWNSGWINIAWLVVMMVVASFSVVRNSALNRRIFLVPVFLSFFLSVGCILIYFNTLIIRLEDLLNARYFVVIGGMLMGNSLRGNIIGISNFYKDIKRNEERYLYRLALGATVTEATMPFFRNSLVSALRPTIASMATIGIVFIPGMMTGQILGGASPVTAIKYQIAIMVAIFVITAVTITLTIFLTLKRSTNEAGLLREDVFRGE